MPQSAKAQKTSQTKTDDRLPADFTFCEVDQGKLLLLEELGSGAYGRVYKAIDAIKRDKNRKFAVKCLRKFAKNSRDEMFQMREFVLHKKVSPHPNVVNFRDAFYENDHVFVVLELCEGGDLFTAIVHQGLFDGNEALIKSCFAQILDGVQYCHKRSVFHRDLKPENILCSKDGKHFRLADFGLATDQRESLSYGCGSAEYMSPECIGKEFGFGKRPYSTAKNDIWALGVILINLITARSPWQLAGTKDYCFKNFLDNPTWLLETLPVSGSAFALMMSMLQLYPQKRTGSISELRRMVVALDTFYALDFIEDALDVPSSSLNQNTSVSVHAQDEDTPVVARADRLDDDFCGPLSDSDSDSDVDSVGPITPETHPVRPELEVPDIADDEDIPVTVALDPIQPLVIVKPGVVDGVTLPGRPRPPVPFDNNTTVKLVSKPGAVDGTRDPGTFGLGAIEAAEAEAVKPIIPTLASPLLPPVFKVHQPLPVRAEPRGDKGARTGGRVANIVKALEELCISSSQKDPAGPATKEQVQPKMQDAAAVDQRGQRERGAVRKFLPKVNIRVRLSEFL
ncbi:hypothetical protein VKT23_010450 [Stygiomarasmius scandens]|uniref:Protein kinase domain-containing protein n=1 Tax=Marasmiellus scandens TaxID=2682957 RepID=A0ABR1JE86_9AGAR